MGPDLRLTKQDTGSLVYGIPDMVSKPHYWFAVPSCCLGSVVFVFTRDVLKQNSACSLSLFLYEHQRAYPANTKTFRGNVLGTVLWKVFLTFSKRLCGSFSHKNQGIFTENLISDYPFLPMHHPEFM